MIQDVFKNAWNLLCQTDPRAAEMLMPRVVKVHSRIGKVLRAEPVAALYEQNKVHHLGSFPLLEDQLCSYVPRQSRKSPDRMDALVWAITELAGIDGEELQLTNQFSEWESIAPY